MYILLLSVGFISMNAVSALASVLRFVAVVWMWPEALFVGRLLASVATAVTYQSLILFLQVRCCRVLTDNTQCVV